MAAQLKVKRGSSGNLSSLPVVDGQLLFTTDTKKIYLDNGATRLQVGGGTVTTGSANGTIAVDGVDVAVKGLGARAFDSTSYLPSIGGTIYNSGTHHPLTIKSNRTNESWIKFAASDDTILGYLGALIDSNGTKSPMWFSSNNSIILHAGNYSSYALPLSGGTLTGSLSVNGSVQAGSMWSSQVSAEATVGVENKTLNSNLYLYANKSKLGLYCTIGSDASKNIISIDSTGVTNFIGNASTATKLATARTFTIGNSSFTFDGTANVGLDTSKIFTTYTSDRSISWNDLPTGFTEMAGGNDAWSGTGNPTNMAGFYRWGGALTLNANGGAFAQMYFAHIGSSESGILYRTGWYSDKKGWARILDSNNYTSYCAPASHTHNYLPLSGGTITGNLSLSTAASGTSPLEQRLSINGVVGSRTVADAPGIGFHTGNVGWATMKCVGSSFYFYDSSCTGYVPIYGSQVYGAVWNDYAEFRSQNETIEPGYITYCDDDGKLKKTTERLQKYEGIVSDTFGFAIGETDECKTPLAVSGRALVYCDPEEEHFHSGDCVCAGPSGLAYRMTREEIMEFPDRIVGVVSEIPTYETWGTGNVAVNGRIWIKVR